MRWNAEHGALLVGLVSLSGCVISAPAYPPKEQVIMEKSGSRIPAPKVQPVSVGGVRYEQIRNGLTAGLDQMGGYLAAIDEATGQQLWTLKVYDNQRVPGKEGDVQDVFFKSLTLQADGTLLIENERRARFIVDTKTRTSTVAQ